MLPQKSLKPRCLRLVKNAFAIQHSIVYTFIHYCPIKIDAQLFDGTQNVLPFSEISEHFGGD